MHLLLNMSIEGVICVVFTRVMFISIVNYSLGATNFYWQQLFLDFLSIILLNWGSY